MVKFTIGEKSSIPDLKKNFESKSIKNLFVIGSLSGIPLIKNAIIQGKQVVKDICFDCKKTDVKSDYDLIIIGGGPAGVTAALEAKRKNLKYLLIERGRLFELVRQYPYQKPIYAEPQEIDTKGDLSFKDKAKEDLLEDWDEILKKNPINFVDKSPVSNVIRKKELFTVETSKGNFTTKFIILAIGDAGNPKKLKIPGEHKDHVHHKLTNPKKHQNKKILVVGGGNSAVEAAIALAQNNNDVIVSYRGDEFFRASKINREKISKLEEQGKIDVMFNSTATSINEDYVVEFKVNKKKENINFDEVYVLIGFDPSVNFMEKINVKLAKTLELKDILGFLFIGFITLWIYSYNKGVSEVSNIFSKANNLNLNNTANPFNVWSIVLFATLIIGLGYIQYAGFKSIKKLKSKVHTVLIALVMLIWLGVAASLIYNFTTTGILFNTNGSFWPYYTLLYALVVTTFGLMSILKYKTRYIWNRTLSLIYSQLILLFLLPVFVFKDWRFFSLVYVWPLGPDALTNISMPEGSLLSFVSNSWFMWIGILLSFVIFTVLVYYKGRGAFCSWLCGCGALSETLGDPFRTKTPQGKSSKKLEYASYVILGFAAVVTIFKAIQNNLWPVYILVSFFTLFFMWYTWKKIKNIKIPLSIIGGLGIGGGFSYVVFLFGGISAFTWYKYIVDFSLAGWIAIATYFFIGGRIWCRYFCPLISYLGIISSIGRFKIRPKKDKCISCGLCTRNCHMGIDVMSYAQKNIDMKEPSCVGCGICVEICPMDLFTTEYDKKTIGPGTSYQVKANPSKLQILAMGGKPEAAHAMLVARAKLIRGGILGKSK